MPPVPKGKQPVIKQSVADTEKMDLLTEQLYDFIETKDKSGLVPFISEFFSTHGEQFANLRDSSGNCFIHTLCTALKDTPEDANALTNALNFLIHSAKGCVEDPQQKAAQNYLKMLPISMHEKSEILADLGIEEQNGSLSQIVNIIEGNSFGQTPLHLLASQKKVLLLPTFLNVIYNSCSTTSVHEEQKMSDSAASQVVDTSLNVSHIQVQPHNNDNNLNNVLTLLGFNPNEPDSTQRTFMHILLEKGLLTTFEEISNQYCNVFNLKTHDYFNNSVLMAYKQMKKQQLEKLRKERKIHEYIVALKATVIQAFGDLRNVLFERELGTNILTEFVVPSKETEHPLIVFEKEIKVQLEQTNELPSILQDLTNIPDKQGQTIGLKILNKLDLTTIEKYFEILGGFGKITYIENPITHTNALHCIICNKNLNISEKQRIISQISDQMLAHLYNKFDSNGNLPLNHLIDSLSQDKIEGVDIEFFKQILHKTDLSAFKEQSLIAEIIEREKRHQNALKEQRQTIWQHEKDNYVSLKPKGIKNKSKNEVEASLKLKMEQKKELDKFAKVASPINPLETTIKRGLVQIARILMSECQLSPMLPSSNCFESLLEISALSSVDMFKTVVNEMPSITPSASSQPIYTTMKIYQDAALRWQVQENIPDAEREQFNNAYKLMLDKIFGTSDQILRALITQEFLSYEVSALTLTNSNKNALKLIREFNMTREQFKKITAVHQLILLSAVHGNYQFIERLQSLAQFENKEAKEYFLIHLIKQRASRNDINGMKEIISLYPEVKEIFVSSANQHNRKKLAKSMFKYYVDIVDTDVLPFLAETFSVQILPVLKEQKGNRFRMDPRFSRLPAPYQNQLIKNQQENAFKFVVNLLVKSNDMNSELLEAADIYLKGSNKQQYLEQLAKQNAIFQLLDIRRQAQQEMIGQFISLNIKLGNLDLALLVLKQLKEYIEHNCSVCPIDFYAETQQFERNYPYRDFKMTSLIRKMNYKSDKYPLFLGQLDSGEIDDDQEEYLTTTIWEEMLLSRSPLDACRFPGLPGVFTERAKKGETFIPNGNVVLFNIFAQVQPTSVLLTQQNTKPVQQLIDYVFEFGGFPLVEISNISSEIQRATNNNRSEFESLEKKNKILQKFNQTIKTSNLQTIIHQLALDKYCDLDLVKRLCKDNSLQRENFNSRDFHGKTPVALAIEAGNFQFLQCLRGNKSIFLKDNNQTNEIIQNSFDQASIEQKVHLLKFIADNVKNLPPSLKDILVQSNKKQINEIIDLAYLCNDAEKNEQQLPKYAKDLWKTLGTTQEHFSKHHQQILETYKLMRAVMKQVSDTKGVEQQIIFGRMISQGFLLGKLIVQIASMATVQQIQTLEACGFDMTNVIVPSFSPTNVKNVATQVPPNFPFDNARYYMSFALKCAIQNQPENRQLIDYLFQKVNLQLFRPFLFELMLHYGTAYGTKDPHFLQLFTKEKAYLMGKLLTVESRIRCFKDSRAPLAATQYYNEKSYRNMLVALATMLIENNEFKLFKQFVDDQARFYLCSDFIIKGIQAACRNFKPKFALILAALSIQSDEDEKYFFIDYSNILPDPKAVVTMKEVQQTQLIVKSLDKQWTAKLLFKKLSREMMDEFVQYLIEYDCLPLLFDLEKKISFYNDPQMDLIIEIYNKASPETVRSFVKHLLSLCQSEKATMRIWKRFVELPSKAAYPPGMGSMSKHHAEKRKKEVKAYLMSKIDKFAGETCYFKFIADDKKEQELADVFGIDLKDIKEFRKKVIEVRKDIDMVNDKEFVYSEMQTLFGVFKVKSTSKRPNRSEMSSIADSQRYSTDQVMRMNREELKTKSENLILLWEFLHREEKRRKGETFSRDQQTGTISDLELRELIMKSQPSAINIECIFQGSDTSIINNDLEEVFAEMKFSMMTEQMDFINNLTLKQCEKLMSKMLKPTYYSGQENTYDYITIHQYTKLFLRQIPLVVARRDELLNKIQQKGEEVKLGDDDNAADPEVTELRDLTTDFGQWSSKINEKLVNYLSLPTTTPRNRQRLYKVLSLLIENLEQFKVRLLFIEKMQRVAADQLDLDDIMKQLVGGISEIFTVPQVYKDFREKFYKPLVCKLQQMFGGALENTRKSEGNAQSEGYPVNDFRFLKFLGVLLLPVFNSTNNDELDYSMRKQICKWFLEKCPRTIVLYYFLMMISNPPSQSNDEILLLLAPFMKGKHNIGDVSRGMNEFFKSYRRTDLTTYKIPSLAGRYVSNILIKQKHLNVVKDYINLLEDGDFNIPYLVYVMQTINLKNKQHVDIMNMIMQRANLDLSLPANANLLPDVLKSGSNAAALLKYLDSFFGPGTLLESYIEFMKSDSTLNEGRRSAQENSLLYNLISNQASHAILAIKEIANPEQWEFLKNFKTYIMDIKQKEPPAEGEEEEEKKNTTVEDEEDFKVVIEEGNDEQNKARCFFVALLFSEYDICSMLLPSDDEISETLTYMEMKIVKQFLQNKTIKSYHRNTMTRKEYIAIQQIEQLLNSRNVETAKTSKVDEVNSNQHNPSINILKQIIVFPEILRFIYLTPEKYGIDFKSIVNNTLLSSHPSFNHQIEAFFRKFGLVNGPVQNLYYEYPRNGDLYLLEHGYNYQKYLSGKQLRGEVNQDMIIKPYSYFERLGLLKTKLINMDAKELFETEQLNKIYQDFEDEIYNVHQTTLAKMLENSNEHKITGLLGSGDFAFTYYLLNLQLGYQLNNHLDVDSLNHTQWGLYFQNLAQDLVIVEMLNKLFKSQEKPLYQALVGTNVKHSKGKIFYQMETKEPIFFPNQDRFLALMLAFFNSSLAPTSGISSSLQLKLDKYDYENGDEEEKAEEAKKKKKGEDFIKEGKLPEPSDLTHFTEIFKSLLRATQAYNCGFNNTLKNSVDFNALLSVFEDVKKALLIYDQAFGPQNKQFKELTTKLGLKVELFDETAMTNNPRVTDQQLLQAVIELAQFDTRIYSQYFDWYLNFADVKSLANSQQPSICTLYPQTYAFCNYFTSTVNAFLLEVGRHYRFLTKQDHAFVLQQHDPKRVTLTIQNTEFPVRVTRNEDQASAQLGFPKEESKLMETARLLAKEMAGFFGEQIQQWMENESHQFEKKEEKIWEKKEEARKAREAAKTKKEDENASE